MGKKELKVEIPGKGYPREWEFVIKDRNPSVYRLRVHGGWILALNTVNYKRYRPSGIIYRDRVDKNEHIFIPDPNHEWVLEPLKEEPEEETSEVMKELHKKSDEASEDIRKLKRNPEKTKEKTNKSWFSRLFRSNNG
jgi:hypothetical protein